MATTQALTVTSFGVHFRGKYSQTNDFRTYDALFNHSWPLAFGSGTGSGNANFKFQTQLTIAASLTGAVDLRAVVDDFTNTVAMTKLKGLLVRLTSSTDTAAQIAVGAHGTNPFSAIFGDPSDTLIIRYQGFQLIGCNDAGYTVDATHRNILITNLSATQSVVVDVVGFGEK